MEIVQFNKKRKSQINTDSIEINSPRNNRRRFLINEISNLIINRQFKNNIANSYYLPYLSINNVHHNRNNTLSSFEINWNKRTKITIRKDLNEKEKNDINKKKIQNHPRSLQKKAYKAFSKDFNKVKPIPKQDVQNMWKTILGYDENFKINNLNKKQRIITNLGLSSNTISSSRKYSNLHKINKKKELVLTKFPMLKNLGMQGLATERRNEMMKQTKLQNGFNCIEFSL